MDSNDQKDKIINEISSVVQSLTLKLATHAGRIVRKWLYDEL